MKVSGKDIAIFAPFRLEHSAFHTFTRGQLFTLCAIGLACLAGLAWFRLGMLAMAVAVITALYVSHLVLDLVLAASNVRPRVEERIEEVVLHRLRGADWPSYTILCPLYHEAQVVPQFVQAMSAIDYPTDKLQILFLTEQDDNATRAAIRALGLPAHFKIVTVPDGSPRTKPRACNYGLMLATGQYIVIFDAEDIPDPLQLKKAVLTFANHDPNLACVQAKLNFYNPYQNVLTRWFAVEYSLWFDLVLPGLQRLGFPLPLGGTSNHFRTHVLRALGGWDAFNVTEDCDLGLRLARYKLETVVMDSTTNEEANSQLKNFIRQRSRWIKGYMQTYLVHMRRPWHLFRKERLRELASLQVIIGGGSAVFFLNPLMWLLLAIYFVFRPEVQGLYHQLFPRPVLYAGAFCLIAGNFFYVFLAMLGCMQRKQYQLMKWALLMPLYWALLSVAGVLAAVELVFKPHYWQKTQHGLHLKSKHAMPDLLPATHQPGADDVETVRIAAVQSDDQTIPSITGSLLAMKTVPVPAISRQQKQAVLAAQRARVRDVWLPVTLLCACIASVTACVYFLQHHDLLTYDDALSHMRIARSVLDSATPGIAQLGTVWLPLPHILMLPFIWNNYLWRTGLAGSFVSMPCYVLAAIYLFLLARRLTGSSSASFIGTLVFVLNPNVLYLQSVPLSETVCMATLVLSVYYFVAWVQDGTYTFLVICGLCTFLATLARYDGWAVFVALFCLIPIIGRLKGQRWSHIRGDLLLFGLLASFGIVLWFIWNQAIFGDFLYFQRSVYSAQAQQAVQLQGHQLFTYHDLWQSLRFYTLDVLQTIGPIPLALAIVAVAYFLLRHRFKPITFAGLVLLVPFAFYVLALYGGQAVIWLPDALPRGSSAYYFNVRYGAQMVAPTALFVAILVARVDGVALLSFRWLGKGLLVALLVAQSALIASQGIISLQEGQYYYSCRPQPTDAIYLAQHYDGGKILEFVFTTGVDATEIRTDFKNIIYEGSGRFWRRALRDPAQSVGWILVNPGNPLDRVGQAINVKSPAFLSEFTLVASQTDGILLFHRSGGPTLPSRPAPPIWQVDHRPCL